jgi:hypothetical protein
MVITFFSFSFTSLALMAYSKSQLTTMHMKIPGKNTRQFKGLNYHPITDDNTEKHGKYLYQKNKDFYKTKAVSDET